MLLGHRYVAASGNSMLTVPLGKRTTYRMRKPQHHDLRWVRQSKRFLDSLVSSKRSLHSLGNGSLAKSLRLKGPGSRADIEENFILKSARQSAANTDTATRVSTHTSHSLCCPLRMSSPFFILLRLARRYKNKAVSQIAPTIPPARAPPVIHRMSAFCPYISATNPASNPIATPHGITSTSQRTRRGALAEGFTDPFARIAIK